MVYYLKVTFDDYVDTYPTEATHYQAFNLNMRNCQVSSFNKFTLTDIDDHTNTYSGWGNSYNVILNTPIKKFPYTAWTESIVSNTNRYAASPTCGYAITYSVKWRTYYDTVISLPPFITWKDTNADGTDPQFWMQSTDTLDLTTAR